MNYTRGLATLFVAGFVAASASAAASTQSESSTETESASAMTPEAALSGSLEQRLMAQVGLSYGFINRLIQSELSILVQENRGRVGSCTKILGGGSIKLKSTTGTFVRKSIVEIYYDHDCTDVFARSTLTVKPTSFTSVSITETATFHRPAGTVAGTLKLLATGAKTSTALKFVGTGTWTPSGGGAVDLGVSCDYPLKLHGAKPFPCSFGIAQSFKPLNMDLAALATMKVKVSEVAPSVFDGAFTGSAQFLRGGLGKLGVTASNQGVIGISGPTTSLGSVAVRGSARLTIFAPPPCSWSVTNALSGKTFSIAMAPGNQRASSGTIRMAQTTLASFAVDNSGEGSISFSDGQRSKIVNWLLTR